jgi:TonB family protein
MFLAVLAAVLVGLTGCDAGEPATTDATGSNLATPDLQHDAPPALEEGAVDELPVRLSGPNIEYPEQLRHDGQEGYVLLTAVVGADGAVEPGSVTVDSATHPGFEAAAAAWLESATFRPGTVDGKPVRVRIKLPVAFRLDTD